MPLENGSTARSPPGRPPAAPASPSPVGERLEREHAVEPDSATAARSGSATITAFAPALRSCLAISSGVSSGLIDVTMRAERDRGVVGDRPGGAVRRRAARRRRPCPMPSAASPAATRRDPLGELGVGRHGAARAVDQRRLVAARGRAAEHVLGQRDVRDLHIGVRAAKDHAAQPTAAARRRYAGGGGVETTKRVSDGGSPVSSNVPSDSSSTPSTMWRTDTARYSWRSARALVARPRELGVGDRQEVGVVRVEEVRHA